MPAGKLAAQAGHAFLDTYLHSDADRQRAYRAPGHGTKVTLTAPTLEHLLWAEAEAVRLGLPCARVTDAGHVLLPHFTGEPIITALGLGPVRRAEALSLTRRFALVR